MAVGHMLSGGRGPRNPFGDDFAANGNVSDFFGPNPPKLILISDKVSMNIHIFMALNESNPPPPQVYMLT